MNPTSGLLSIALTFGGPVCALVAGCAESRSAGPAGPVPAELLARGRQLYEVSCASCHQKSGAGARGVAPPLAGSSWTEGSVERLVRITLHGVRGPLEVKGVSYNLEMPGLGHVFDDEEVAAILTYVRQAWGNRASAVSTGSVTEVREATTRRGDSWTLEELVALE
ncbi:MAG: cytochrome c [Planctomycetota bacterium]|nr:cytochrome c [Planctomycetota bacterium]